MTKKKPSRTEKEIHKQAFEHYYDLGQKRTYCQVANRYQVSVSTIKNWARDFKWQKRVEEQSAEDTKKIREEAKTKAADRLERKLKMLDLAQTKAIRDIVNGRSKVTPKDMLNAMEMERRLLEMKQVDVDDEGNPASDRPNLFMIDNGRGDCTLPPAAGPDGKTGDEPKRPEDTDKD